MHNKENGPIWEPMQNGSPRSQDNSATPSVRQDYGQMVAGKGGKDGPLVLSAWVQIGDTAS